MKLMGHSSGVVGVACALTLLAVSTAQAETIHVNVTNCPGPGSGSVGDPYCSIQTAIDNAVDTDEIVVAPGTYFEAINFLGKAITLRSSDGSDVTTIDGTGFFHVVQCVSGEGPDTVFDGFTVTGGNADGEFFPDKNGGGMLILDGSPTVTNCTFSGNSAIVDRERASASGGGMYNNGSPTVTNCTFSENSSNVGGGMNNGSAGNPTVTNCTFTGNSAIVGRAGTGWGGGMHNNSGSSPTLTNCTFSGNSANFGGGMFNFFSSSPTVTNCTFSGNSSNDQGGGMYNLGDSPTVINCTFSGNSANVGGGMVNVSSSPTVTNCTFGGNSATFGGGGMRNISSSSPTVTNCTFSGNRAGSGGGMRNSSSSSPTVSDCTFSGNTAINGNALAFDGNPNFPSGLIMTNCILWDGGDEIWNNDGSVITINYTDVQGGWPGTGNIDADPLFVDPDNGDFRLQAGSPCIDAGDNTAVPEGVLRDLDGNPRFVADACAGESGVTVDMGAYEFQGTSCDLSNIPALLAAWGSCPDCGTCPADFDGDCSVGILDLLILLGNWG